MRRSGARTTTGAGGQSSPPRLWLHAEGRQNPVGLRDHTPATSRGCGAPREHRRPWLCWVVVWPIRRVRLDELDFEAYRHDHVLRAVPLIIELPVRDDERLWDREAALRQCR